MKIIYFYCLIRTNTKEQIENGQPEKECLDKIVVDSGSDNICIGGHGTDGEYYQFDSYEAYYANDYFAGLNVGLTVVCVERQIVEHSIEAEAFALV